MIDGDIVRSTLRTVLIQVPVTSAGLIRLQGGVVSTRLAVLLCLEDAVFVDLDEPDGRIGRELDVHDQIGPGALRYGTLPDCVLVVALVSAKFDRTGRPRLHPKLCRTRVIPR